MPESPDTLGPHEYLPPAHPDAPVIVALHGDGNDERTLLSWARKLHPEAGVFSPRGWISKDTGGYRFFRRAEGDEDYAALEEGRARLHESLHAAAERYGFKLERAIALGYSNGSNLLAHTLLHDPHLFRAAVLWRTTKSYPHADKIRPVVAETPVLMCLGGKDWKDPVEHRRPHHVLERHLRGEGGESLLTTRVIEGAEHSLVEEDVAVTRAWLNGVLERKDA